MLRASDQLVDRELVSHNPVRDDTLGDAARSAVANALLGKILDLDELEDGNERASRRTARPKLRGLVVVAIVVALVVSFLALVSPGARPPESAAAVLKDLSAEAAQVRTTLAPGQFAYTEVRQPGTTVAEWSPNSGETEFSYYFVATTQLWVSANGSGREVQSVDPTPQFSSAADRAASMAGGKKPSAPTPLRRVWRVGRGGVTEKTPTDSPSVPIRLYDVSRLPTNEHALGRDLSSGRDLPAALDRGVPCSTERPARTCVTFERATALLEGPTVGSSPGFRASLFSILASLPGVRSLGTVFDRAGKRGTGLELVYVHPAGHLTEACLGTPNSVVVPYSAYSVTDEIVVNPRTTAVLATEGDDTNPALHGSRLAFAGCHTVSGTGGPASTPAGTWTTVTWTTVLATGVVGKETAVPHPEKSGHGS